MSDLLGSENLAGSDSTSALRSSFGKAKPMVDPSRERASQTIRPIRNFTCPRTSPSELRGSSLATARISSTVTMDAPDGIRTRATASKGLRPRPLVDGGGLRRIALGLELLLQPREVLAQLLLGCAGDHRLRELHERAGLRFRDDVQQRGTVVVDELVVDRERHRAAEGLQRQPLRRVAGD